MYESLNLRIPHPSTNVKDISKFDELPQSGSYIIFFMTPWDNVCQKLSDDYDEQSELTYKEVKLYRVNGDISYELFNIFKIESIPTFISMKNGVEIHRINCSNTYKYFGKTYEYSDQLFSSQITGYY